MATRVIYKDAGTGKIITKKEAERRPNTTYGQTVKIPRKGNSSK